MLQGISQKWIHTHTHTYMYIERERERETHGNPSSDGAKCFNPHGVGIYTVLQGSYSQQR